MRVSFGEVSLCLCSLGNWSEGNSLSCFCALSSLLFCTNFFTSSLPQWRTTVVDPLLDFAQKFLACALSFHNFLGRFKFSRLSNFASTLSKYSPCFAFLLATFPLCSTSHVLLSLPCLPPFSMIFSSFPAVLKPFISFCLCLFSYWRLHTISDHNIMPDRLVDTSH